MRHVANKLKMTLAALVSACMLLSGVPAVAFAAAGEAATDAVGSLGDAIESLAADAGGDPAIAPLSVSDDDDVTTLVFNLSSKDYLQPELCLSKMSSDVTIDWGDGTTSTLASTTNYRTITKPTSYAATGTYTVTLISDGTYWLGNASMTYGLVRGDYRTRLTSVVASSKAVPQAYSFYYCQGLKTADLNCCNTSGVTSMADMFYYCEKLISVDVSNFDTSKVTSMDAMFFLNEKLETLDLSGFNTSNVTDMDFMFSDCFKLSSLDLSNFNTTKVTTMHDMFYSCSGLVSLDLSKFDTSQATDMSEMFDSCRQLRKITLGSSFCFSGKNGKDGTRLCSLPEKLSLSYETTNYWINIDDASKPAYPYDEIPNKTKATYYAEASETPLYFAVDGFDIDSTAGYDGSSITPSITTEYLEGTEYTVSFSPSSGWSLGDEVQVTITGIGNYKDESNVVEKKVELIKATPTVSIPSNLRAVYGDTLTDVELPDGWAWNDGAETSVGDAGINAFEATYTPDDPEKYATLVTELNISVLRKAIDKEMFDVDLASVTYTGSPCTKEITSDLEFEKDYTADYLDNTDAGTAQIVIAGVGNYRGSFRLDFTIEPAQLVETAFQVSMPDNMTYTGEAAEWSVTAEDEALEEGRDFDVTCTDASDKTVEAAVNAGTYTITIAGKGNYEGSFDYAFTIAQKSIECEDVVFEIDTDPVTYTDAAITKAISGTYNEMQLKEGSDYQVDYYVLKEGTRGGESVTPQDVGTYEIVITGEGNYTGELSQTFTVTPRVLTENDFAVSTSDVIYSGTADKWSVVPTGSLQENRDYTVVCTDGSGAEVESAVNVGTYTITVAAADNNCTGSLTYSFTITQRELSEDDFVVDGSATYTGDPIVPGVAVTSGLALTQDDYTVSYLDANGHEVSQFVDAGDYTVRVSAAGSNCTGSADFAFTMDRRSIKETDISCDDSDVIYTGEPFTKEISITYNGMELVEGIDYTVVYEDNVNYGVAYIFIEGAGNFNNSDWRAFGIYRHTLSEDDFVVDTSTKTYTGAAITKQVTPTGSLVAGKDYTVTYADNTEVGTATITIAYAGDNCRGSLTYHFTITSNYLTTSSFKVDTSNAAYTGSAITKKITPVDSLVEGRDYVVAYANNVDVGTATLIITGINNCFGQVTYTFKIVKPAAKLHAQTIKLAKKKVTVKHGKKAKVKVKGAKTKLVAKPKNKKAKKALKVKVKGKKKLIVRAKPNAKRGTYKVKVYAKQAGSYSKSKTVKLKVKVK